MMSPTYAVGVDLGGTKTAAGLVDATGRLLARTEAATPGAAGPAAVLDLVADLVRSLLVAAAGRPDLDGADVAGVGIGAAGVIDPADGHVVSATDILPGWPGTRIPEELLDRLRPDLSGPRPLPVRTLPIRAVNDVHAHAEGEAWCGAGQGRSTVLLLAAGTGIGGATVINGHVQRGAHGLAGHFGHLLVPQAAGLACTCGALGHLEAIAAGPALPLAYQRAVGAPELLTTRQIMERADSGDPAAHDVVVMAASSLGQAVGGLMNVIDPDIVLISGGLAAAGDLWWSELRGGVRDQVLPPLRDCPVQPGQLGSDAAIIGAARPFFDDHERENV